MAALLLGGCAAMPPPPPIAADAPRFDVARFFAGATEGRGEVRAMLSRPQPVTVHGSGQIEPDGTIRLDQRVERTGKPATTREWRLKADGGRRWAGTLSDAVGPVTGEVDGSLLHLRYRAKTGGLGVEQWIALQPGGRVALNRMRFTKLGMPVAVLTETIRKVD